MRNDLNLSGNELLIYAVVYGFSQDGESWYQGSRGFIADWAGCSKDTVSRYLSKMVDSGLLEKRKRVENNQTFTDYRAVPLDQLNDDMLDVDVEQSQTHKQKTATSEQTTVIAIFDKFSDNVGVKQALRDFAEFRRSSRTKLTKRAAELTLIDLEKLAPNDPYLQIQIIEQSIKRGWRGLFPLKDETVQSAKVHVSPHTQEAHVMSRRELLEHKERIWTITSEELEELNGLRKNWQNS